MTEIRTIITQLKAWFPPEAHKERDLPGGGKWFYLPWQLIRDRFDEVCPEWEVSYSAPSYLGDYCAITCTITLGGISKQGVGNAEIMLLSSSGKNMARGTPIERATADAFKNAAENWGVGRYLDDQTDPKTKADFIRYMQHAGDGRGADFHHRNEGNLPAKVSPRTQSKPFGKPALAIAPSKPTAEPMLASAAQMKRFWAIAKNTGYSQEACKALIEAHGFTSSKEITVAAYDDLCRKAADADVMAVYSDRQAAQASGIPYLDAQEWRNS